MNNEPVRKIGARGVGVFLAVSAAAFALSSLADRWVYDALDGLEFARGDWYAMFRVVGYLPVWLVAAGALLLTDSAGIRRGTVRAAARRATFVALAALFSGIAGELLKLLLRRERPDGTGGEYVFRSWLDGPLRNVGMGLPCSHTNVAFGGTWAMCLLFPRAAPIWLGLAAGCGLTRVLPNAHFVSDVVLSAIVAYAIVALLWRWQRRWPRLPDHVTRP